MVKMYLAALSCDVLCVGVFGMCLFGALQQTACGLSSTELADAVGGNGASNTTGATSSQSISDTGNHCRRH